MTKTTFYWIDKGPISNPPGQQISKLYQQCTAIITSYLDAKVVDPKAPDILKDDTPFSSDMTAARFYERSSTNHVYVPLIDDKTPLDTFWHWVGCATDQDPAGVALPMFVSLCAKRKGSMALLDTARNFMEVHGMTSGTPYDNAIAKSWCQQIETKMKDPTYTSFKAIEVIRSVNLPAVKRKAGVGRVVGGHLTKSTSSIGKHMSISCLLLFVLLLCILSTVIGHMFMWEATSFVLSKVHPGGVFSSASAMQRTLTGRPVNLLVYEGPGGSGCDIYSPTPAVHFMKFHDLSTKTDNKSRVLGVVFPNNSDGEIVRVTETTYHDVVEKATVLLLDLSTSPYSRQCTAQLLHRLPNVNADCFYQCVLEYVDTSILKTVCSKILKGASEKMMRLQAAMVALWSLSGVASRPKLTNEEAAAEASKWTLAYVYSLWTGENWYTKIFQTHADNNFLLSTVSEEYFMQNMLFLARCHENPAILCVVCVVSLASFWHMVVYSSTHSATFKDITVGSAAFFKDTANSWHHTDLFDNKKGAIITGKQSQTRVYVFFIHLVYLVGLSLCKSMYAYAATWNAFCQIIMIPAWSLFATVSFMGACGVLVAAASGKVVDAIAGMKDGLKASGQVLGDLADTGTSVVHCVATVILAGQVLGGILSPSIDVFFYAHYCGLWCNALLALHVGIDSAVTVFTRALSPYVAYQTCLGVANTAVVLACAVVVRYVHTRCGHTGAGGVLHAKGNNSIVFTCNLALLVVVVRVLLGAVLSKQTALLVTFRAYDMFTGGFVVHLGCGEVLAQWVLSMVLRLQ